MPEDESLKVLPPLEAGCVRVASTKRMDDGSHQAQAGRLQRDQEASGRSSQHKQVPGLKNDWEGIDNRDWPNKGNPKLHAIITGRVG